MSVVLEAYDQMSLVSQARDLTHLTTSQPWLENVNPGLVSRYESTLQAARNVLRIARDDTIDAYIVRDEQERCAQGIATVIRNQYIHHPDSGEVFGDDLDYWLVEGSDEELHDTVAARLLHTAAQTAAKRLRGVGEGEDARVFSFGYPYFFTTTIHDAEPLNRGLLRLHETDPAIPAPKSSGPPAILSTRNPRDPYGLTRDGVGLRLYRGTIQIHESAE